MIKALLAVDAFSNPDSPWYYVVGVGFLVILIAALVAYMLLSKKKGESKNKVDEGPETEVDEGVNESADEKPQNDGADIEDEKPQAPPEQSEG